MKDLIGETFGELTVINEAYKKGTRRFFLCKCSCGKEKIVRIDNLNNGNTKSCGHLKNIRYGPTKNSYDHIGEKFGRLTIIGLNNFKIKGAYLFQCQCDCGTIILARYQNLKSGATTSCGCLRSKGEEKIGQLLTQNNIPFLKEYSFNTCRSIHNNALYRFDFFVNNQYLIEYDGIQHYKKDTNLN